MLRRHPFLTVLAVLLTLTVTAITVFLLTFNLNLYRGQLQRQLSATLHRPVKFGSAHLSLLHGPSIAITGLHIGAGAGEKGRLQVKRLYLRLEFRPLLRGNLAFSEVLLDSPRLSLTLHPAGTGTKKPVTSPPRVDTRIATIRIRGGTLQITDLQKPSRPFRVTLQDVDARFQNFVPGKPGSFHLAGVLHVHGKSSPVRLAGRLTPPAASGRWQELDLQLEANLHHLSPGPLLAHYAGQAETSGDCTLELKAAGSPATGMQTRVELRGNKLRLQLPQLAAKGVVVNHALLQATWMIRENALRLQDLQADLNQISLRGGLSIAKNKGTYWLQGDLGSSPLDLGSLVKLLPDRPDSARLEALRRAKVQGTLQLQQVRFSGPLKNLASLGADSILHEARISLQQGAFYLPEVGQVQGVDFTARWSKGTLRLQKGTARLLGGEATFAGSVAQLATAAPDLELQAQTTLPVAHLLSLLPAAPQKLTAAGPLPLELSLSGHPKALQLDLSADLQKVAIAYGADFHKAAGVAGKLFLAGDADPAHFVLGHGRLTLGPLDLRAHGQVQRRQTGDFALTFDLAPFDLLWGQAYLPLLRRLQTRGKVTAHFEITRQAGKIHRGGSVSLHRVGLHLTRTIADLNQASGRFLLKNNRVEITHLSARLGTSPISVHGTLKDFTSPRLDLYLQAPAIRADELIFPSAQAILHDLRGHLVLTAQRLLFAPVTVRLAGGTDATVRGSVTHFTAPQVNLDITAPRANIDEVIALWNRPAKPPEDKTHRPPRRNRATTRIIAHAARGHLGGLHFQDAEGVISISNGILLIHPLHFRSGSGYCVGSVAVDSTHGSPPLLKISGHIRDFDASVIYHDLLHRRGLLTGRLRGDFYLQGTAGSRFLPTSMGGFSLEIDKGVLREFTFLSKVFSLLNVSQIFTLHLPDMSLQGMPFTRLTANLQLNKGILSTEDLFVESNAMNLSLVGSMNLNTDRLHLLMGVKPLRTVDKIITKIPIAGWILTGKERALITAQFKIKGRSEDPEVLPIPITSLSKKVLGIFRRVLGLPGKIVTDFGGLVEGK